MATRHNNRHVGLQNHSLGEHYPWTISAKGYPDHKWHPFHCLTGEWGPGFASHSAALAWIDDAIAEANGVLDEGPYLKFQRSASSDMGEL